MPELPEVETARAYVEEFCRGSTILQCNAMEQGGGPRDGQFDGIVIGEDVTVESLQQSLEGRQIVDLKRRGKQMWMVFDQPPHALFHFGMTGSFTVKGEKRHKFVKFKVGEEWPPRFTKLELQMSNGACLALTDPRRLARVLLRTEPEAQPPISLLGADPITHPLTLEEFSTALSKPKAPIKAVLLDQNRVVSGVGNWVADEVCFQACIHPGAACNTLSPSQVTALHSKLLSICREACDARADYTVFPKDWLFHHRWGKGKTSGGAPRVSSGDPIHFDVVGGRTTAFVPAVQKKGLLLSKDVKKKAEVGDVTKGEQKGKGAEKVDLKEEMGGPAADKKRIRGKGGAGQKTGRVKDEPASATKHVSATRRVTKDKVSKGSTATNQKPKGKGRAETPGTSKTSRARGTTRAVAPATAEMETIKRTASKSKPATAKNAESKATTTAMTAPRKIARGKLAPATNGKDGGQRVADLARKGGACDGTGKRKRVTKEQQNGADDVDGKYIYPKDTGVKTTDVGAGKRAKSNATSGAGANRSTVVRRSPRFST